ncbi:type II toxin-antitoxin system RelE/ParE family toxin [candidate division KSB1 bacterium]|nr:type II toxin-antitoxin system RelE/ParE family toxin [candidate division KSB1 bacterium]
MGKHLAVYKVEEDVVTIVRVLHQNRDVERHL